MTNVRSGNLKVSKMKDEIAQRLYVISLGCKHKRALRQLKDGQAFLLMIEKEPYRRCDTVSKLKQKISEQRNLLKKKYVELDVNMPGHQLTFFETAHEVSKQQQYQIRLEQEKINSEIRWLHKCLGMCSNKDYFN